MISHGVLLGLAVVFCCLATGQAQNNSAPTFTNLASDGSTTATIAENAANNTIVMTLSANDDSSSSLTFGLVTSKAEFNIIGSTLRLAAVLDYEQTPSYVLVVSVSDGLLQTNGTLTVAVVNVNDEPPIISLVANTTSITEGLSPGTIVTFPGLTVTDADARDSTLGEKLTYSLQGSDSHAFRIDSLTGEMTTSVRLDREQQAVYTQLLLQVSDAASPSHTATTSLTVSVIDVNDVTPSCAPAVYYVTVVENTLSATSLVTLSCTDSDEGSNGQFNPTINSGDPGSRFQLSGLQLQTGSTLIDFEKEQSYTLTVHLIDTPSSGTANTGSATIVVMVTGTDDHDPVWVNWTPDSVRTSSAFSVSENINVGASLFTVSATDDDLGPGSSIVYKVSSNSSPDLFRMDPVSGELSTLRTLDRDVGNTAYNLTITADDGTGVRITQVITLNLLDANDNSPRFSLSSYSVTLPETRTLANSNLIHVTATDKDATSNLTYSVNSLLVGNHAGKFTFSSSLAGQLQLTSDIDLDAGDDEYYVIIIQVTDGGVPELTGSATVTLTVLPSNEHTPVFGTTGPVQLSESTTAGTLVIAIPASDNDVGRDGEVIYSITNGNSYNSFTIDKHTGEIRTLSALDYETIKDYNLEVTATDGGSTPKSASTTVSIAIIDENDNIPSCTNHYIFVNLPETASVNDNVTSLECSDLDQPSSLTYTITSGNQDGKFSVDFNTGYVTLATTVDYDSSTQFYILQVSVSDGSHSQSVTVKVTLQAVNEMTPSFDPTSSVFVSEGEVAGYTVTTYTAKDTDYSPHDITAYAIAAVSQGGNSKFTIDQSSGLITLRAPLDYETLPVGNKAYVLTVTATDGGGQVGTETVIVEVQDINDNSPICIPSSSSISIQETVSSFPQTLASLNCMDAEAGTNLTYAMTQSPGSHFSVASDSVLLINALDYEMAASHTLTIIVSDSAASGARSTTVFINVIVENMNDGPPVFSGTYDVSKAENIALGTLIADVSATDPDGSSSAFGNPQHSIFSGDPMGLFQIDPQSGRVTTRAFLDAEVIPPSPYYLEITAVEQGGSSSASTTLTVTVVDVNDVTPSCNLNIFGEIVLESASVSTPVLTLTCNDGDVTPTNLTYAVTSGDTSKFEMNGSILQLKSTVDFESGTRQYPLAISVSDGTNAAHIVGTVLVGPVNEHQPVFAQASYPITASENLAMGSTVGQVTAKDDDSSDTEDGELTYAFASPQTMFAMNSATGAILLAASLDREVRGVYEYILLVTAHDSLSTATTTVVLTVVDENDNAPQFTSATYTASVSELEPTGTTVITVKANDFDDPATDGNGNVTYSPIIDGDTNGHFSIDMNSGVISTTEQLDADSIPSYTLTITARDRVGRGGALTAIALVLVTVTSENQHEPVFTKSNYTAKENENLPIGTRLIQVKATDADAGSDGIVTYSMAPHAQFALAADGWISLKANLDFETTPNTYVFDVTATDGGTPVKSSTAIVSITVGDINDNYALCVPSVLNVQKQDNFSGAVTSLSCSDADSGLNSALNYFIESVNGAPGQQAFAVDSTGTVTVLALDYETDTSLFVVISVADQGTTPKITTVYLTVAVIDVNEYPPVFSGTPLSGNVAENAAVGSAVLSVTATDADASDVISYSLADTTHLEISSTGLVTLKAAFDFENSSTYSVDVCARDSNAIYALKTTCQRLSLSITDVNDNIPVFNPSVYSTTVDENAANGVTVITVTATDADRLAAGGSISYLLVAGNADNVFRVDSAVGHLIVDDNAYLDYERNTDFTLTIRAQDGGGKSADAVVTVVVKPVNEDEPTFAPASSTISVSENATAGPLITLTASDMDHGVDGKLNYVISLDPSRKFSINPWSGEVSLLVGNLDREAAQKFALEILAVDGGLNPGAKTGTYSLTIDVTDINDVTPSCSSTIYIAAIPENALTSTLVKSLSCVDNDLDPANLNNALMFSIISGNDGGHFAVDNQTGTVTVTVASFDRETMPSYRLELQVADRPAEGKLSTPVTLLVEILDVNDNSPVFSADSYAASVPENGVPGDTVLTVIAADNDTGSNAAITYSLTSSAPAGKFAVNPTTGDIIATSALDFETDPAYVLVVTATDQGVPPRSHSATASIAVTDLDDQSPVCSISVYSVTLPEDAAPSSVPVVNVTCPDADTPNVTYSLTSSLFTVNAVTGVVTLSGSLDYETAPFHTITVSASDGARSDFTTVQVTVTDVNEFAPVFDPPAPYSVNLSENSTIGTTVVNIGATDRDLGHTTFTFSITRGNTANKFGINAATGVILLQKSLDRDREVAAYTLNLEVSDGKGATARTAFTTLEVTVDDVNDNAPVCSQSAFHVFAVENVAPVVLMILNCTDIDASTPIVKYTLLAAGNVGNVFSLDPSTGALSVVASLDYENLTSYDLSVEVDDQGSPSLSTLVTVTVSVTPVNEFPPAFPSGGYNDTEINEAAAVGSSVIQVSASDDDKGSQHGSVRYSIIAGNGQGDFIIDLNTGQITLAKPLDREGPTSLYILTVRAADDVAGSGSEKSADVSVNIAVSDANDNYPEFHPTTYSTTIRETAVIGGTVLTVTASDDDAGSNAVLTVFITAGNTGNSFIMGGSLGTDLILNKSLDYETTKFYQLVVEAVDGGMPALTSQARITIAVEAVNEDAPVLNKTNFVASIPEDEALGTLIYTAAATDNDQDGSNDGSITYAITAGDTVPSSFIIDPNSGELRVFSRLDFDTPPQTYNLTVEARDGGGKTDTEVLTLILTDVNDHTPQFSASTYSTALDENVSRGHSVITLYATDNDSGVNGQVTYTATGGNGQTLLAVNNITGIVTTTGVIDYELTPILYLVVQAADGGAVPLSSTVLLRVIIRDLNDNPPVVVPDDFTVSLPEDVSLGTQVTTIGATDRDTSANNNNVIVYSLTNNFFEVDPSTGVTRVRRSLDRESFPSGHILKVVVTDQGTNPHKNSATATVTVLLQDVNDNDPVITGIYDSVITEDTAVGTILFQIIATDADMGDNGRLTYTIVSGNTNNDLNIIDTNGMIQVARQLDREVTASYLLKIQVADNGNPLARSSTVIAKLTISDVNDNDPVFIRTPYIFSVAENSVVGEQVGKITATDADAGLNANLVYSIQNVWTGESTHFALSAATGQITTAVASLDRETRDIYFVSCRVTDQGSPQRYASVNITIRIADLNDNPPVFSHNEYFGSIKENSPAGTSVMDVVATDADVGVNAALTFVMDVSTPAGARANSFLQVDPSSGRIRVKAEIDHEIDTDFLFEVKAIDQGSPALTSLTTVTVEIIDVNDNFPTFSPTFINTEAAYGSQCTNSVAQFLCQDADWGLNGKTACYFGNSNSYNFLFNVDGPNCTVTTRALASANAIYLVKVQCRDSGIPVLTAAIPATLRVDTFIPDEVIIRFELSISRSSFVAAQETFMTNIEAVVRASYSTALVRLWCIQERAGSASVPGVVTGRRRLLQTSQPVDVMIYAVRDNTTDSQANVNQGKAFFTTDELMALFAADATGKPASSVTGPAWDYYDIQRVTTYTEQNRPWFRTPVGIVLITLACLLAAALLCLLVVFILRRHKKSRPVTPLRPVMEESKDGSQPTKMNFMNTPKLYWTHADTDKTRMLGAAALPAFAYSAAALQAFKKKREEAVKRESGNSRLNAQRKESGKTTRTTLLTSEDEEDKYPISNRSFDRRALDPVTGGVYEYNTRTHEKRWLNSPFGVNV